MMKMYKKYRINRESPPNSEAKRRIRAPISIAQVMQRTLDIGERSLSEINWGTPERWNDFLIEIGAGVHTNDTIIYHPNGNIKIVLGDKIPNYIFSRNRAPYGGIALDEQIYDSLEGMEFEKNELEEVTRYAEREGVKNNRALNYLARDSKLLSDFTDYIYNRYDITKKRPISDRLGALETLNWRPMKIHLDNNYQRNCPEMRTWIISGKETGSFFTGSHRYSSPIPSS
jgi:hypothetical protein